MSTWRLLVAGLLASSSVGVGALYGCVGNDPSEGADPSQSDGGGSGNDGGGGGGGGGTDGALVDPGGPDAQADGPSAPVCDASPCVVEIAAGGAHTCARIEDGTVRCWGANGFGESGTGSVQQESGDQHVVPAVVSTPTPVSGITNAVVVGAGGSYRASGVSCVGEKDLSMHCWGIDSWGELGRGSSGTGETIPRVAHPDQAAVSSIQNVVSISVGVDDVCAVIKQGSIACWGSDESAQLGTASTGARVAVPQVLATTAGFLRIATSGHHSVALSAAHEVWTWGDNANTQCAAAMSATQPPAKVSALSGTFVDVAAGRTHSCALAATGQVFCWGRGTEGELGHTAGDLNVTPSAVPLGAGVIAKQIAADHLHTCALLDDGTVTCWGMLITTGTIVDDLTPTKVTLSKRATQVAVGYEHACALLEGGSVECWGNNASGELGRGASASSAVDLVAGPVTF